MAVYSATSTAECWACCWVVQMAACLVSMKVDCSEWMLAENLAGWKAARLDMMMAERLVYWTVACLVPRKAGYLGEKTAVLRDKWMVAHLE